MDEDYAARYNALQERLLNEPLDIQLQIQSRFALRVFASFPPETNFRSGELGKPSLYSFLALYPKLATACRGFRFDQTSSMANSKRGEFYLRKFNHNENRRYEYTEVGSFLGAQSSRAAYDFSVFLPSDKNSEANPDFVAARRGEELVRILQTVSAPGFGSPVSIPRSLELLRLEFKNDSAERALARDLDNKKSLASVPLWGKETTPIPIEQNYKMFLDALPRNAFGEFWRKFYQGMWNGTFDEWDLTFEVIKIDEAVWEEGIEAVATEIEKIEARLRTAVTTPLIRSDVDGAFVLDNEPSLEAELLDYLKERVGGALSTALKTSGNNGFDEECEEALAISRALESENPSAVAGLLNDASLMFQTNLGNRYPEDGALIALQAAAFSTANEICETNETARKRCLRASKLYRRENAEVIDPEELKEFTETLAAETVGEAQEILKEDGKAIALGKSVGNFIRARFANYSATIVQWIDKFKKGVARVEWLWKMVRKLMDYFTDTPPNL